MRSLLIKNHVKKRGFFCLSKEKCKMNVVQSAFSVYYSEAILNRF